MSMTPTLSLTSAILININIMLGTGIFINTVLVSHNAGALGAAVYALVGILLLPLIFAMAQLLKHFKGGTFYDFGKAINTQWGFITSWCYFIAKLSSCALGIHVFSSLIQTIFPRLAAIPTLGIDYGIIILFILLNTLNLRIGRSIQFSFMGLKLIPIIFALISGVYLFTGGSFTHNQFIWSGIPSSIPFVLYAFTGFEATCSLSRSIKNPEKNGPRAVLIAYSIGVGLVVLYQLVFFGALGTQLGQLSSYLEAFPTLINTLFPNHASAIFLKNVLHIGIASSALGAAYGVLYSNAWNLYALAIESHIPFKHIFTRLNKHKIPLACVLAEGALVVIYTFFAQGNQIPLQQISSCGITISYTLSTIALLVIAYRAKESILIPLLSLGSCVLLFGGIIRNCLLFGWVPLALFFMILGIGSVVFITVKPKV